MENKLDKEFIEALKFSLANFRAQGKEPTLAEWIELYEKMN